MGRAARAAPSQNPTPVTPGCERSAEPKSNVMRTSPQATSTPPAFGIGSFAMLARMRSKSACPPATGSGVNALPIAA